MEFAEIAVGYSVSFHKKVLEEDMEAFARITGDLNPLHTDEAYAARTKFKKKVVYGMLAGSYFSALVGMYMPGDNALYLSQDLKFTLPIFIGDELVIKGEVTEKHESVRMITIKTTIIRKSDNKVVVNGEAKVLVR